MQTFHLHIKGQVQGVGFRPYVYKLAKEWNLKGHVNNGVDGVHIEINACRELASKFLHALIAGSPRQVRIDSYSIEQVSSRLFRSFQIIESLSSGQREVRISPDFGMCEACKKDLYDPESARHLYSFTTCTHCGPRYSILMGLPYDRVKTSMAEFTMCPSCQSEYQNPTDRRFYSQTNSCPHCPVTLTLMDSEYTPLHLTQQSIITQTIRLLNHGQIIAIKGIGGYLLCCDATDSAVIEKLRQRKQRPDKPFALLYPSVQRILKDASLQQKEVDALTSPEAPIVLLKSRKKTRLPLDQIAPGLSHIGVMLPYAPLLSLISEGFGKPLVATSGNVSGSPILYEDAQAMRELSPFADFILTHDRPIVTAQDDSVVRFSGDQPILLRRSRGFAPSYFGPVPLHPENDLLAMGAHMKGTFALTSNGNYYVSQYLGSLEGFESQVNYRKTLNHLTALLQARPHKVLVDSHPGYFATQMGRKVAGELGAELHEIQHHKAHFAAILQEKDLIQSKAPILGIIWDGTGYGENEQIWGGEFFMYQNYSMERVASLNECSQLLGDKMIQEPRLSALAFCPKSLHPFLKLKFTRWEWPLYEKLLEASSIKTTSMGRLFDAVASILGLVDKSTFEGQAAMYLEALAEKCTDKSVSSYPFRIEAGKVITSAIISAIINEMTSGIDKSLIARKFHLTLVEMIRRIAEQVKCKHLAFSGGVFQNALLVRLIKQRLGADFKLFFHELMSANDENIAFGQLAYYHLCKEHPALVAKKKSELCV